MWHNLFYDLMDTHFNLSEIQELCFRMNIDYENFQGQTKAEQIIGLTRYCERLACLSQLIELCKQKRPTVNWPELPETYNEVIYYRLPPEPYYPTQQREIEIGNVLKQLKVMSLILISGIGGIGKTALTIETARRCLANQTQNWADVLWVSAKQSAFIDGEIYHLQDTVLSPEDLFDKIGKQASRPNIKRLPLEQKADAITELFQQKPYLLVIDNLETLENAQALINMLSYNLGKSCALISSRREVHGNLFLQSLSGLNAEDSLNFMREEANAKDILSVKNASDADLLSIYEVTGGNPLAMKLVIGQVRILDLDVVLRQLRNKPISNEADGDQLYQYIYRETWQYLSEEAQMVLIDIATYPSSISRHQLEVTGEIPGKRLDQALTELVSSSLIVPSGGLRDKRYSVHQLTRNFIANALPSFWSGLT